MPVPTQHWSPADAAPPKRLLDDWKALVIRWVQEAQSAEELASAFRALVDALGGTHAPADSSGLFPGLAMGSRDLCWSLLPAGDFLYAFLGAVVGQGLITASWTRKHSFEIDVVYVRTTKGLFRTRFRTLADLRAHLRRRQFTQVHRSMAVGSELPVDLVLPGQVRVRVGNELEVLRASRRNFDDLLERYGLTRRTFGNAATERISTVTDRGPDALAVSRAKSSDSGNP